MSTTAGEGTTTEKAKRQVYEYVVLVQREEDGAFLRLPTTFKAHDVQGALDAAAEHLVKTDRDLGPLVAILAKRWTVKKPTIETTTKITF